MLARFWPEPSYEVQGVAVCPSVLQVMATDRDAKLGNSKATKYRNRASRAS